MGVEGQRREEVMLHEALALGGRSSDDDWCWREGVKDLILRLYLLSQYLLRGLMEGTNWRENIMMKSKMLRLR